MNIKNRKELDELLEGVIFQFHYRVDSIMSFRSIAPVLINEDYVEIELEFFDIQEKDLFDFSTTKKWLGSYQLFRATFDKEVVFFEKWKGED